MFTKRALRSKFFHCRLFSHFEHYFGLLIAFHRLIASSFDLISFHMDLYLAFKECLKARPLGARLALDGIFQEAFAKVTLSDGSISMQKSLIILIQIHFGVTNVHKQLWHNGNLDNILDLVGV